jgi:hypothetical protein
MIKMTTLIMSHLYNTVSLYKYLLYKTLFITNCHKELTNISVKLLLNKDRCMATLD